MKKYIGLVAGCVFGIMFVAKCGGGGHGLGLQGMLDGGVFGDGMTQAHADSSVMTATCDKANVYTNTYSNSVYTLTNYYADISVPGINATSAPHVSAYECDNTIFGQDPYGQNCPAGATCTSTGDEALYANLSCRGAGVVVLQDHIKVSCGYRSKTTGSGASDTGYKGTTVYVRIN